MSNAYKCLTSGTFCCDFSGCIIESVVFWEYAPAKIKESRGPFEGAQRSLSLMGTGKGGAGFFICLDLHLFEVAQIKKCFGYFLKQNGHQMPAKIATLWNFTWHW